MDQFSTEEAVEIYATMTDRQKRFLRTCVLFSVNNVIDTMEDQISDLKEAVDNFNERLPAPASEK